MSLPEQTGLNPAVLPLLPLRDVVVFPHMVIPLFVGRPKSIKALEAAMESGTAIVLEAALQPLRPRILCAFIFGSMARAAEQADSDTNPEPAAWDVDRSPK